MVWKPSRACFTRTLASSFSSFFRCCRYSLKQAFFSPRDFKALYLHNANYMLTGVKAGAVTEQTSRAAAMSGGSLMASRPV